VPLHAAVTNGGPRKRIASKVQNASRKAEAPSELPLALTNIGVSSETTSSEVVDSTIGQPETVPYEPTSSSETRNEDDNKQSNKAPAASFWPKLIPNSMPPELPADEGELLEKVVKRRIRLRREIEETVAKALRPVENKAADKKHKPLTGREQKIWNAIQRGLKGAQYCRELHNAGVRPRTSWIKAGCPGTYPGAYLFGAPWRHRIQDEKCDVRKKGEALELVETR
jgi:hypothetical protein